MGSQGIELQLLGTVNTALADRNGPSLQSILLIEPPFPPIYEQLIASLRTNYPPGSPTVDSALWTLVRENVLETHESEDDQGRPVPGWNHMVGFLAGWMAFIRDVDVSNLLVTYERLSELQGKANSALQHANKGIIMLPTVISYAKLFSRVAIGLDRQPELISSSLLAATASGDEGRSESLPERAANIIRNAFVTCLNYRNREFPDGIDSATGKPADKKIGIYALANICLKVLFQSQKLESCQTLFNNIQNSAPPLAIYPAAHRVTYLYFLGRYHFAIGDFYGTQLALQKAYDDCPTAQECLKQRRLIIIPLVASNFLCGRLPRAELYTRPESAGLREHFEPLAQAIRHGDLEAFRRITKLDLSHPSAPWLCHHNVFYQLGNYCTLWVWRSLFRKVFLAVGKQGENERSAPTLDLYAVLAAFLFYEKRALLTEAMARADGGPGNRHISLIFSDPTPAQSSGYVDPDFEGLGLKPYLHLPDLTEIEAICGSLITQGFLNGYMSFAAKKFAIMGAKKGGGALKAGFPNIWETILKKNNTDVLGWKKDMGKGLQLGGVLRLSGARPAGA